MNFQGRDVISIKDFSKKEINHILSYAKKMIPYAKGEKNTDILNGKILSTLFFEPSTRTRLSFESAMNRLGGRVIGFADPSGTSQKKGESLADTIRMANAYSDAIVIRHPQEGAARLAAEFADIPVLNAGDGAGHHPTQCLLDLFTILTEKKRIEKNKVVLLGDLKYGRTVHSLAYALALYGAELIFVSPPILKMPKEVVEECSELSGEPVQTSNLEKVIKEADVFIDVGVAVGHYVIKVHKLNAQAIKIAIEPDFIAFNVLKANLAINGIPSDRVKVLNIACSDKEEEIESNERL